MYKTRVTGDTETLESIRLSLFGHGDHPGTIQVTPRSRAAARAKNKSKSRSKSTGRRKQAAVAAVALADMYTVNARYPAMVHDLPTLPLDGDQLATQDLKRCVCMSLLLFAGSLVCSCFAEL